MCSTCFPQCRQFLLTFPISRKAYMARFELSKDQVLEQKQAFDVLDLDGNGKITFQEVKEMNQKLGTPMSEQELSEQFITLDIDGNNIVTFPEFLKVFVKGEFGRDVMLPNVDETIQVTDLAAPEVRPRAASCTLDPIDESKIVMKLSKQKSAGYYVRAAKQMLTGSQDKAAFDLVELNALGHAIPHATTVAAALVEEKLAQVASIHTGLQEVPDSGRHCRESELFFPCRDPSGHWS
ncbi:unnamed protein product [Durusdinium trenchii]|uniref:Uncharacterized protein n=2 Tax=Durusdinium trenchii TaxID=1381693 RepID=A0ABP0R2U8_9DINO